MRVLIAAGRIQVADGHRRHRLGKRAVRLGAGGASANDPGRRDPNEGHPDQVVVVGDHDLCAAQTDDLEEFLAEPRRPAEIDLAGNRDHICAVVSLLGVQVEVPSYPQAPNVLIRLKPLERLDARAHVCAAEFIALLLWPEACIPDQAVAIGQLLHPALLKTEPSRGLAVIAPAHFREPPLVEASDRADRAPGCRGLLWLERFPESVRRDR
jgi:hypothetical protein